MTSSRPYLVRAMYQWIVDNGMTPHLLVNAEIGNCEVPQALVNDGKIVLNVAPMAVNGLILGDEKVTFSARFDGKPGALSIPIEAVLAIYARENGQGMMFSEDDEADFADSDFDPDPDPEKPGPKLRVIK